MAYGGTKRLPSVRAPIPPALAAACSQSAQRVVTMVVVKHPRRTGSRSVSDRRVHGAGSTHLDQSNTYKPVEAPGPYFLGALDSISIGTLGGVLQMTIKTKQPESATSAVVANRPVTRTLQTNRWEPSWVFNQATLLKLPCHIESANILQRWPPSACLNPMATHLP